MAKSLLTEKNFPRTQSEMYEDLLKDFIRNLVKGERTPTLTTAWDWLS